MSRSFDKTYDYAPASLLKNAGENFSNFTAQKTPAANAAGEVLNQNYAV